jgi:hypothetical protein
MWIIRNKYIPFGKFSAMNILGLLFVREDVKVTSKLINHEAIHTEQQYEIMTASALVALVVANIYASWWYLFIVVAMPLALYVLAWLIALALPPYDSAYIDSPFEREAYLNQNKDNYLVTRPLFAWVKYIFKQR